MLQHHPDKNPDSTPEYFQYVRSGGDLMAKSDLFSVYDRYALNLNDVK